MSKLCNAFLTSKLLMSELCEWKKWMCFPNSYFEKTNNILRILHSNSRQSCITSTKNKIKGDLPIIFEEICIYTLSTFSTEIKIKESYIKQSLVFFCWMKIHLFWVAKGWFSALCHPSISLETSITQREDDCGRILMQQNALSSKSKSFAF